MTIKNKNKTVEDKTGEVKILTKYTEITDILSTPMRRNHVSS